MGSTLIDKLATGKTYKEYFNLEKILEDIKSYLPNFNEDLFIKAFNFAEEAHRGQMRKDGTTPYIVHPIATIEILIKLRADEDILISALLHDVPEDTSHPLKEISTLFGEPIAFLVDGITKLSKVHYQHNMPERQIESLKKLFLHSAKDPRVILIKLADRLHNMRTLEFVPDITKRFRISRETLEIYVPIANLLGIQELKSQLEDLCFKHLFPTEYEQLKTKLESSDQKQKEILDVFIKTVKDSLKKNNLKADVSWRSKTMYSIYKKICAQGRTIEDIDDRIGIRIIVDNIPECYQVLGIVHSLYTPKIGRFKDYIANSKVNGYQSLHTTVFGVRGTLTEVQIRTEKMHLEAEYGIAAHFFYDSMNKESSDKILANDHRFAWARKILEMEKSHKDSDDFLENLRVDIFQDRIFVFTPKGATIDLPKGASAIDFAYAIHTEVGNHASKVQINELPKPITTILKTGDVVNVITSKEIIPDLYWLSFAKTNVAKNKIRFYLKRASRKKKLVEGHRALQKEFDLAGLGLIEEIGLKKIRSSISKHLGKTYPDLKEIYIAVGSGNLNTTSIVKAIKMDSGYRSIISNSFLRRIFKGSDKEGFKITLRIEAKNKFGLMKEISNIIYTYATDVISFKGRPSLSAERAYFKVQLVVDDLSKISKIFNELEQLDEVKAVQRTTYRVTFYIALTLTGIIWIVHPFLLEFAVHYNLLEHSSLFVDLTLYAAFFMLLFTILYLTNIAKKYFSLLRQKKRLWIISFLFLTFAIAILLFEFILFKIHLSRLVILGGALLMYIYLGLSYLKIRGLGKR